MERKLWLEVANDNNPILGEGPSERSLPTRDAGVDE